MGLRYFSVKTCAMEEPYVEKYTYIVIGGGIAGVTCAEHVSRWKDNFFIFFHIKFVIFYEVQHMLLWVGV